MATIRAKGHEFPAYPVKDSHNRRAVQFMNHIIQTLSKLGVPENQTDIKLEPHALKNAPATAVWYMNGHRLYYSYDGTGKYAENLYVVSKVIALEVEEVITGKKPLNEFIEGFTENEEVEKERKEAREALGLSHDEKDLEEINKKYKELAKAHHPDTPTGNITKFKAINKAHKILKRELE